MRFLEKKFVESTRRLDFLERISYHPEIILLSWCLIRVKQKKQEETFENV